MECLQILGFGREDNDCSTSLLYSITHTHHLTGKCLDGNKIEERRIVGNERSDEISIALHGTKSETQRLLQEKRK